MEHGRFPEGGYFITGRVVHAAALCNHGRDPLSANPRGAPAYGRLGSER